MSDEYPRIGSGKTGEAVYMLVISDFIEPLKPPKAFELDPIDPNAYYITSGDAIQKAEQLHRDLFSMATKASARAGKLVKLKTADQFAKKCWEQVRGVGKLLTALREAKGSNVFLETEWMQHILLCLPKNPRVKKPLE